MSTPKEAKSRTFENYPAIFTNSARSSLLLILKYLQFKFDAEKIAVPAYIGWSPKEGSGVCDCCVNGADGRLARHTGAKPATPEPRIPANQTSPDTWPSHRIW